MIVVPPAIAKQFEEFLEGRIGSGLIIQQKDFQLAQAPDKLRILLWWVLQAF